jgi:hypothetical protein
MRCRKQGTSAQPLDQPHLYLRLLAQRGGEADLQGVVSLTITRGEVRAAYGLDFRERFYYTLQSVSK